VGEEIKEVTSTGAGWSFLVPTETRVQCADFKAVLAVGPGLNIVVTSYIPITDEPAEMPVTEMMVRTASEDVLTVDPNAAIAEVTAGAYGEAQYSGHCGGAKYSAEGHELRAVVCSVSAPGTGGAEHVMLAAMTDTEEGFAEAGVTDAQLFSQLVDGWTPVASAR
jgi:hypothetical protein